MHQEAQTFYGSVGFLQGLYNGIESAVKCGGGIIKINDLVITAELLTGLLVVLVLALKVLHKEAKPLGLKVF